MARKRRKTNLTTKHTKKKKKPRIEEKEEKEEKDEEKEPLNDKEVYETITKGVPLRFDELKHGTGGISMVGAEFQLFVIEFQRTPSSSNSQPSETRKWLRECLKTFNQSLRRIPNDSRPNVRATIGNDQTSVHAATLSAKEATSTRISVKDIMSLLQQGMGWSQGPGVGFHDDNTIMMLRLSVGFSPESVPAILSGAGLSEMASDAYILYPGIRNLPFKDCDTTDGFEDCGARALTYLFAYKSIDSGGYNRAWIGDLDKRVAGKTKALRMNTLLKRTNDRTNFNEKKTHTLQKDIFVRSSMCLYATAEPAMAFGTRITSEDMVRFCYEGCLGAHVRIRIWVFDDNALPVIANCTPDRRLEPVSPERIAMRHRTYRSPSDRPTEWFDLFLYNDHYYAVTRVGAFKRSPGGKEYTYCESCAKFVSNYKDHKCALRCLACLSMTCIDSKEGTALMSSNRLSCGDCGLSFFGESCFQNHRKPMCGSSRFGPVVPCQLQYYCPNTAKPCTTQLFRGNVHELRKDHKCLDVAYIKCRICFKNVPRRDGKDPVSGSEVTPAPHLCYIDAPTKRGEMKIQRNVWYYDFETIPVESGCGHLFHEVNDANVQNESGTESISFDTIAQFMEWLLEGFGLEEYGKCIVAHNAKGFDAQLIHSYLIEHTEIEPQIIYNGRKIMKMMLPIFDPDTGEMDFDMSIKLLDSLNFAPFPLAMFPHVFGFDTYKTNFPFKFNPKNKNYSGPIPNLEMYEACRYSKKSLKDFLPWYYQQVIETNIDRTKAMVQLKESLDYLTQDMLVLGKTPADLLWLNADPEMIAETVYLGPWVLKEVRRAYCEQDVTVLRLGMEKFRGICMDLFQETAIPFSGEGNSKPENLVGVDPLTTTTIASLAMKVFMKKFYKNKELAMFDQEFVDNWGRPSFRGGRTEAFMVYKSLCEEARKENPTLKLSYEDVMSLYPFINKCGWYTTKHYTKIDSVADARKCLPPEALAYLNARNPTLTDLLPWFLAVKMNPNDHRVSEPVNGMGLIRLDFKGPSDLRIPVLPSTDAETGRLVFDLKQHLDEVIASPELEIAYRKGYTLTNVKGIRWWSKKQCKKGIFGEYVDTFLKMKMEAAGWQKCKTTEAKEAMLLDIANVDGIELNPENIAELKNAGLYAVAKLFLNSLWGKFNQRANLWQAKEFEMSSENRQEFWDLITNKDLDTNWDVLALNKRVVVRFRSKKERIEPPRNTNIMVGVLTTSQARALMYRHIEQLHPDQICYMDTDSIIYVQDQRNKDWGILKIGGHLGDLTDELKPNQKMIEFGSGGPKNYGQKLVKTDGKIHEDPVSGLLYVGKELNDGKTETELKVKGFNLKSGFLDSNSAQNALTYDSVKRLWVTSTIGTKNKRLKTPVPEHRDLKLLKGTILPSWFDTNISEPSSYMVQIFRITTNKRSQLENRYDIKRSYNWIFSKRKVITDDDWNTDTITTVPFGYGEAESKEPQRLIAGTTHIDLEMGIDYDDAEEDWHIDTIVETFSYEDDEAEDRLFGELAAAEASNNELYYDEQENREMGLAQLLAEEEDAMFEEDTAMMDEL